MKTHVWSIDLYQGKLSLLFSSHQRHVMILDDESYSGFRWGNNLFIPFMHFLISWPKITVFPLKLAGWHWLTILKVMMLVCPHILLHPSFIVMNSNKQWQAYVWASGDEDKMFGTDLKSFAPHCGLAKPELLANWLKRWHNSIHATHLVGTWC